MTDNEKKTWLKEQIEFYDKTNYGKSFIEGAKEGYEDCAIEICKKILEKVKIKNIDLSFGNQINYFALEEIIKDLGVDL